MLESQDNKTVVSRSKICPQVLRDIRNGKSLFLVVSRDFSDREKKFLGFESGAKLSNCKASRVDVFTCCYNKSAWYRDTKKTARVRTRLDSIIKKCYSTRYLLKLF